MGTLELEMDERRLVTHILERAFLDLKSEIYKTDTPAMKDELRREEAVLGRVLEKLGLGTGHSHSLRDAG